MDSEFKNRILNSLPEDKRLGDLYKEMTKRIEETLSDEDGPITTEQGFRIDVQTRLFYKWVQMD
jgi:hypothetical protein